jgi:hypothetical protein
MDFKSWRRRASRTKLSLRAERRLPSSGEALLCRSVASAYQIRHVDRFRFLPDSLKFARWGPDPCVFSDREPKARLAPRPCLTQPWALAASDIPPAPRPEQRNSAHPASAPIAAMARTEMTAIKIGANSSPA